MKTVTQSRARTSGTTRIPKLSMRRYKRAHSLVKEESRAQEGIYTSVRLRTEASKSLSIFQVENGTAIFTASSILSGSLTGNSYQGYNYPCNSFCYNSYLHKITCGDFCGGSKPDSLFPGKSPVEGGNFQPCFEPWSSEYSKLQCLKQLETLRATSISLSSCS